MDINIIAIVCIALVLITVIWAGYYTNWFIYIIVTYYGEYLVLFVLLILVISLVLVTTLK